MDAKYMAVVVDRDGTNWVYEGHIDGHPLFVKEHEAKPKMLLTELEAFDIAHKSALDTERPKTKRIL